MRNRFFIIMSVFTMGITTAVLPVVGNPAHAGPDESVKGSKIGIMGTVTDKVNMNTQRAEAAKRLKERRAAAAAEAARKAEAAKNAEENKNTEGGAK